MLHTNQLVYSDFVLYEYVSSLPMLCVGFDELR